MVERERKMGRTRGINGRDERIDHRSNCYKIGVRSRLKSGYGYSLLSSLMLANHPLDPNEFRPFDINLRVT